MLCCVDHEAASLWHFAAALNVSCTQKILLHTLELTRKTQSNCLGLMQILGPAQCFAMQAESTAWLKHVGMMLMTLTVQVNILLTRLDRPGTDCMNLGVGFNNRLMFWLPLQWKSNSRKMSSAPGSVPGNTFTSSMVGGTSPSSKLHRDMRQNQQSMQDACYDGKEGRSKQQLLA